MKNCPVIYLLRAQDEWKTVVGRIFCVLFNVVYLIQDMIM